MKRRNTIKKIVITILTIGGLLLGTTNETAKQLTNLIINEIEME